MKFVSISDEEKLKLANSAARGVIGRYNRNRKHLRIANEQQFGMTFDSSPSPTNPILVIDIDLKSNRFPNTKNRRRIEGRLSTDLCKTLGLKTGLALMRFWIDPDPC